MAEQRTQEEQREQWRERKKRSRDKQYAARDAEKLSEIDSVDRHIHELFAKIAITNYGLTVKGRDSGDTADDFSRVHKRSRTRSPKESHIGDEVQALSRAAKVLDIKINKLGWPAELITSDLLLDRGSRD